MGSTYSNLTFARSSLVCFSVRRHGVQSVTAVRFRRFEVCVSSAQHLDFHDFERLAPEQVLQG